MQVQLVDNSLLKGWVSEEAAAISGEVVVCINGVPVISADVCRSVEVDGVVKPLGFQRMIKEVWRYVGEGDALTVEHAGKSLDLGPLADSPSGKGTKSLGELKQLLKTGHVFDKYGHLRKSIDSDHDWQTAMMSLYGDVRGLLRERFGIELLVTYGTMLGAVREGNFISHDNDIDTAYVSRHSRPADVKAEFKEICEYLIEKGYKIYVKATHTWVFAPGGNKHAKLDIFFSWFDEKGLYHLSYGYFGEPVKRSDAFFRLRQERLGDIEVDVPECAEDVLAQMYGPTWRVPDKGFRHKGPERRIDKRYKLSADEVATLRGVESIYWKKFYEHTPPPPPSGFAQFIGNKAGKAPMIVMELGCGNGRDSLHFASLGHRVMAGDRAGSGLKQGEAARDTKQLKGLSFHLVDAADMRSLTKFVRLPDVTKKPATQDLLLYMRFFLHSVPEDVEDRILEAVGKLPQGAFVAMEFRTKFDAATPKLFGEHYRRYIDAEALAKKMARKFKIDVLHFEQGHGLAVYKDEDPHVARIIGRRRMGRKRQLAELLRPSAAFSAYRESLATRIRRLLQRPKRS